MIKKILFSSLFFCTMGFSQTWRTVVSESFQQKDGLTQETTGDISQNPAKIVQPAITDYNPSFNDPLVDGSYAISTNPNFVDDFQTGLTNGTGTYDNLWFNAPDHTGTLDALGNHIGYMMIINANPAKQGPVNGTYMEYLQNKYVVPGADYRFTYYIANILTPTLALKNAYLGLSIYTGASGSGTKLAGPFENNYPRAAVGATQLPWNKVITIFSVPTTYTGNVLYFNFYNTDTDSSTNGNDLALDDFLIELNVVKLQGKVWYDPNWDGIGMLPYNTYIPKPQQLYVVLVDNNNRVVDSGMVNNITGDYTINSTPYTVNGDIGLKLILTTSQPSVGTVFDPNTAPLINHTATGTNKSNITQVMQKTSYRKNVMSIVNTSIDVTNADFGITYADFGDAPDTYVTSALSSAPNYNNAAASSYSTTVRIGSTVDTDKDGQPSINADGDGADEDGILNLPVINLGDTSLTTNVNVLNSSSSSLLLQGWLDINKNGTFDTSEYVTVNVPTNSSQQTVSLTWNFPSYTTAGRTYMRIRLNDNNAKGSSDAIGYLGSGEVEDYFVKIGADALMGNVYLDSNGGYPDGTPVANVTINLYDSVGTTLIKTTTTDSSGYYEFLNLVSGTYKIKIVLPTNNPPYEYVSESDGTPNGSINASTTLSKKYDFGINLSSKCFKTPTVTTGGLETPMGISTLQKPNGIGNWPKSIKSGWLVLESNTKGLVINRVAANPELPNGDGQIPTIKFPVQGMIVYDITNKCLKVYNGAEWKCLTRQDCPQNN